MAGIWPAGDFRDGAAWPLVTVVAILTFLGIVIWSIRRHRDPNLTLESECGIDELIPSVAGLSLGSVVEGNSVEILENGEFWVYYDLVVDGKGGTAGENPWTPCPPEEETPSESETPSAAPQLPTTGSSLTIMISSAAAGIPLRPSRTETIPSCIEPPWDSERSSQ